MRRSIHIGVCGTPGTLDPRRLGDREALALELTLSGASAKEVAYTLGIAAVSARSLLASALRKLSLRDRAELYRFALDRSDVVELHLEGGRILRVLSADRRARAPDVRKVLSASEHDVATLAADGLTNTEIAAKRGRSEHTVANQMAAILKKLRLRSRVELSGLFDARAAD